MKVLFWIRIKNIRRIFMCGLFTVVFFEVVICVNNTMWRFSITGLNVPYLGWIDIRRVPN